MKLIDIESNESIDVISIDIKCERIGQKYTYSKTYLNPPATEILYASLVVPFYEMAFIEKWQSKIHCNKTGMMGLKRDYAKTLDILYNNIYPKAKLYGAYPTNIEVDISNNIITVNLSMDYYDEIKLDTHEIRDIKIDQILN